MQLQLVGRGCMMGKVERERDRAAEAVEHAEQIALDVGLLEVLAGGGPCESYDDDGDNGAVYAAVLGVFGVDLDDVAPDEALIECFDGYGLSLCVTVKYCGHGSTAGDPVWTVEAGGPHTTVTFDGDGFARVDTSYFGGHGIANVFVPVFAEWITGLAAAVLPEGVTL